MRDRKSTKTRYSEKANDFYHGVGVDICNTVCKDNATIQILLTET